MKEKNVYSQRVKPDIRELTLLYGITYPSDEELMMLILNGGTRDVPVEKLAEKVVSVVNESQPGEIISRLGTINGIGSAKALSVAAALEFGRRRNGHLRALVQKPTDVLPFVKHYALEPKEHFVCISLNGAHEILSIRVVAIGTPNKAIFHPREIFSQPVVEHASGIICCHNHPSGACFPSEMDIDSTRMLQKAAKVLGIAFLDHIIINTETYYSFLENGML
jgi:DNA repair protein RadC